MIITVSSSSSSSSSPPLCLSEETAASSPTYQHVLAILKAPARAKHRLVEDHIAHLWPREASGLWHVGPKVLFLSSERGGSGASFWGTPQACKCQFHVVPGGGGSWQGQQQCGSKTCEPRKGLVKQCLGKDIPAPALCTSLQRFWLQNAAESAGPTRLQVISLSRVNLKSLAGTSAAAIDLVLYHDYGDCRWRSSVVLWY